MNRKVQHDSLARRLFNLNKIARELQTTLSQTKTMQVEVMKKISQLIEVKGFNLTLTPHPDEEGMIVIWSCENRREAIDRSETQEIEAMCQLLISIGFVIRDVQHDPHLIQAQIKTR